MLLHYRGKSSSPHPHSVLVSLKTLQCSSEGIIQGLFLPPPPLYPALQANFFHQVETHELALSSSETLIRSAIWILAKAFERVMPVNFYLYIECVLASE